MRIIGRRWMSWTGVLTGRMDESVFGVDVGGWVEQNRSRDLYELVREPVQNALDTGTDLDVRLDYGSGSVAVQDYDEEGVEDLSRFYDLFSGDKHGDPEVRGRFGRGVKEFIGATDEAVIASTGGGLRFRFDTVYDEDLDEYRVEASRELFPDAQRDRGTVVYGRCGEWSRGDLEEVEDFVEDLWMPRDRELRLETVGPDSERVVTGVEPDAVLDDVYLPTVVYEEGVKKERSRLTEVEVNRTEPGEGGVYELGIPVTRDEEFPFLFNVHQKTPVTERRNELDNSYRTDLMQHLLGDRLDLLDDSELGEDYVTQYVSRFRHRMSGDAQRSYIERRFGTDPGELLVFSDETPKMAVTWAVQRGLPMEDLDDHGMKVRGLLEEQCPTVQDWYTGQNSSRSVEVVEDPGEDQRELIQYFEQEILGRTGAGDVDIELAYITEDADDGQTHASYRPREETIYLNALADDWDSPTPNRIGTFVHELGHHETDPVEAGHGPEWYHTVEELSGEVIRSLEEEIEE